MSPKADLDVVEVLKVKKVEPPHNKKVLALVSPFCYLHGLFTPKMSDNRHGPQEGS